MESPLLALPRSCHDFGKDTMAMQDRAKSNHDFVKDAMAMQDHAMSNHNLVKDAKINHVLDKDSMVANPFFGNSHFLILFIFFAPVSIAFSNFSICNTLPQGEILARLPNHSYNNLFSH